MAGQFGLRVVTLGGGGCCNIFLSAALGFRFLPVLPQSHDLPFDMERVTPLCWVPPLGLSPGKCLVLVRISPRGPYPGEELGA